MDLKGKGCLITGGTSGIGAATAIDFAKRGAHISVTGRTRHQETLRQLQVAVEEHGSRFLFVQADAGNAEDCRRCVDETHAAFGRLDVLVHSATKLPRNSTKLETFSVRTSRRAALSRSPRGERGLKLFDHAQGGAEDLVAPRAWSVD